MNADDDFLHRLTQQAIGCAFQVSNALGSGFLEKVYENAFAHELRKADLRVAQQHAIAVLYDGVTVGEYVADLLIEDILLIELKAQRAVGHVETAQCLNFLKATGLPLCLLINFGPPRIEVRRIIRSR
jgi:GxxExxY protein